MNELPQAVIPQLFITVRHNSAAIQRNLYKFCLFVSYLCMSCTVNCTRDLSFMSVAVTISIDHFIT